MQHFLLLLQLYHKYYSLNYLFYIRKHFHSIYSKYPHFAQRALDSFLYLHKYKHNITHDLSLYTILSLCSNDNLKFDVEWEDHHSLHLSHMFNAIVQSTRKIFKCYDCGTSARAMFLALIFTHTNRNYIQSHDQIRMKQMYKLKYNLEAIAELKKAQRFILQSKDNAAFILSISFGLSGHVWVIDKIGERFHLHQSCLDAYLTIDNIKEFDYLRDPSRSIDIRLFFNDLLILAYNDNWENDHLKLIFSKWFKYLPLHPLNKIQFAFCWTYGYYTIYKN